MDARNVPHGSMDGTERRWSLAWIRPTSPASILSLRLPDLIEAAPLSLPRHGLAYIWPWEKPCVVRVRPSTIVEVEPCCPSWQWPLPVRVGRRGAPDDQIHGVTRVDDAGHHGPVASDREEIGLDAGRRRCRLPPSPLPVPPPSLMSGFYLKMYAVTYLEFLDPDVPALQGTPGRDSHAFLHSRARRGAAGLNTTATRASPTSVIRSRGENALV